MILGESHYCEEGCADCGNARVHPECCAFTNGVVSDYLNESLDRQRWMSTYLKFERSLVEHETDWAELDSRLMDDVKHERKVMDDLYNYLYSKNHPISYQYRMVVTPQFEQHPCCFNLLGHILHPKAFLPPPPKGLVELCSSSVIPSKSRR